jgi:N-acyl-D-aspartate/D-glutamate deacylase
VRKGQEDWLVRLMEGVEDIPGTALHVGLPWTWETYPDYLDTLGAREYALDVACQIPHSAVRAYVLQARAETDEPATHEELEEIKAIVRQGLEAGAIGVGTSRVVMHRGSDGSLVPGTYAAEDEMIAIADAMAEVGGGVFQIIPSGIGGDVEGGAGHNKHGERKDRWTLSEELQLMRRLHRRTGGVIAFTYSENPGLGRAEFDKGWAIIEEIKAAGEAVYPQFTPRSVGALSSLEAYHAFQARPTYQALAHLPLAERVARLRDPAVKAAILAEPDIIADQTDAQQTYPIRLRGALGEVYPLRDGAHCEPDPSESVLATAQAAGRDPLEYLYDLYLEGDGRAVLSWFLTNYFDGDLRLTERVLGDEHYLMGLGDAGAHVRTICDASFPTFMILHWARNRSRGPRLPIEVLVRKITGLPAERYGFADRGRIEAGLRADINVIDLERLSLGVPYLANDLPSDAQRFLQSAQGYVRTIVNGVTTRRNDVDTGSRPGRLYRRPGRRHEPATQARAARSDVVGAASLSG